MLKATTITVEQKSRARMEKKGPDVIDYMALLPPGYKPPRKKEDERKKKKKPAAYGARAAAHLRPTGASTHPCRVINYCPRGPPNTDQQLVGPALVDMSAVDIENMTAKQDEIEGSTASRRRRWR